MYNYLEVIGWDETSCLHRRQTIDLYTKVSTFSLFCPKVPINILRHIFRFMDGLVPFARLIFHIYI